MGKPDAASVSYQALAEKGGVELISMARIKQFRSIARSPTAESQFQAPERQSGFEVGLQSMTSISLREAGELACILSPRNCLPWHLHKIKKSSRTCQSGRKSCDEFAYRLMVTKSTWKHVSPLELNFEF